MKVCKAVPLALRYCACAWQLPQGTHPALGFVMAFAWGGFGAIYLARSANTALLSILTKTQGVQFAADWGAAIAGPTTEELLKILGVILLVMIARTQFRTLLAFVSIGALVGLGFQVLEDLDYTLNVALAANSPSQLLPVGEMLLFRGVISGIWSHAMFTSIAAFGVGYFVTRRGKPLVQRLGVGIGCYLLAWGCHFFWNSPLLAASNIFTIPLRGLPIFVVGALIWALAGREQSTYVTSLADAYVSTELITTDERDALATLRGRRQLRHDARKHGRKAGRVYHRLQRKQLDLIMQNAQYGPSRRTQEDEFAIRTFREQYVRHVPMAPEPAEPAPPRT